MNIIITGIGTDSLRKTINGTKEKLESKYSEVSVKLLDKLPQGSRLEAEDLLVTFNLSGFEQQTLTGGISYNLLNCKQIHILLDKGLSYEEKLVLPLSISMFFFCRGQDYYEYLQNTYPEIPFLQKMDEWDNEGNALADIIENVAKLCHLVMSNN